MDWITEIVTMNYVKEKLEEVDREKFWTRYLPTVAATEEQIKTVEAHIGHILDPKYRLFLTYANGWKGFWHDADLFGTDDFLGSSQMSQALELLTFIEDCALEASNLVREELLPIAVSTKDIDVFFITRPHSASPGAVIWYAGYEIERYTNFDEFFLAMVDYNRLAYQGFLKD